MSYRERGAKYRPRKGKSEKEIDILNSKRRTSVYWRQKIPVQKIDGKYTIQDLKATTLGSDTFGPKKKSSAEKAPKNDQDVQVKSEMADAPGHNLFDKPKTPETAKRTISKKKENGVEDKEATKFKDKVKEKKKGENGGDMSKFIKMVLDHRLTNIVVLVSTVIALFGVDFVAAFLPKDPHDVIMGWISFVIFIVFIAELTLASVYKMNYFLSFFFFLDVLGTLSLIPDIPLFMNAVGVDRNGIQLAKAGRVVRSGTRTTRLLRMMRLVRMVRIVRLFKLNKFFKRLLQNRNAFEESEKEEQERKVPSKVGVELADLVGRRVITLTLLLIFIVPQLQVDEVNSSREDGLELLEMVVNQSNISTTISAANSSVKLYLQMYSPGLLFISLPPPFGVLVDQSERIAQMRTDEYYSVMSKSGHSLADFDTKDVSQLQAMFNLTLTMFLTILLLASSYLFNRDVERVVVAPIERMTAVIRKLASTLFILSNKEDSSKSAEESDPAAFVENVVQKLENFFLVNVNSSRKALNGISSRNPYSKRTVRKEMNRIETMKQGLKITPQSSSNSVGSGQGSGGSRKMKRRMTLTHQEVGLSVATAPYLQSLEALWADESAQQFFKVFLTQEFAVESFQFVQACNQFKIESLEQATTIYNTFISKTSPLQVNISSAETEHVEAAMSSPTAHMFDEATEEIFRQMERDNFPRFLKSGLCQQLLEMRKREIKQYVALRGTDADKALEKKKEKERNLSMVERLLPRGSAQLVGEQVHSIPEESE